MKVLLLYPEFPETFWSFKHALKFVHRKVSLPPLGLLTVGAMLPAAWSKRLVDVNIRRLPEKDLAWADVVFVSAMIAQRDSARELIARAHAAGMKVLVDFVPNHTSMDSKLLMSFPEFFLHQETDPEDENFFSHADPISGQELWVRHGGYGIFGTINSWNDTAQVDYSHEGLRREMTRIVNSWVERFGVDGFRVDMAYLTLNMMQAVLQGNGTGAGVRNMGFKAPAASRCSKSGRSVIGASTVIPCVAA